MIDLAKHQIVFGDKSYPILRTEVWWLVDGRGLYPNFEEALGVSGSISPVPVALAENGIYEVLPPVLERDTNES